MGNRPIIYDGANKDYDDLSVKTQSWALISALIISFVYPLVYVLFAPQFGLQSSEGYSTYAAVYGVINVLLGFAPFLYGIAVNIKYRTTAIVLSVSYIVFHNICFSILPLLLA